MPSAFETVAGQALSLAPKERLRLITELLQSIEPGASQEIEQAWEEEITRRIADIDSGKAVGRPWNDIKRDFDDGYGR